MFVNFSNHPSDRWDSKERRAASAYGEITDINFPVVPPEADEQLIEQLALDCVKEIEPVLTGNDAVMVQGEFTLTYAVVNLLKKKGVKTLSACSERNTTETIDAYGNSIRNSVFTFVRFREYQ